MSNNFEAVKKELAESLEKYYEDTIKAIIGDKYNSNVPTFSSTIGNLSPELDANNSIAVGAKNTNIIRMRPFSTPNLKSIGKMIDINIIPADKVAMLVNMLWFTGKLEKNILNNIVIKKAISKKNKLNTYLLATKLNLDIGMVRAYLSHLHFSSYAIAVIGIMAANIAVIEPAIVKSSFAIPRM